MGENKASSLDLLDENLQKSSWKNRLLLQPEKKDKELQQRNNKAQASIKPEFYRCSNNALMDRVKSFLPKIEAANKEIEEEENHCGNNIHNIENVEGCSKIIEMDISFVQDLRETALSNFLDQLSSDQSNSESESDEESDVPVILAQITHNTNS